MDADDIVEIGQVVANYGHYMDQRGAMGRAFGRPIAFGEIFVEGAAFLFAGQTLIGKDAIENMASGVPEQEQFIRPHHVSNVYVYRDGGQTRVHAKWQLPDPATGGAATGDYHLTMVMSEAKWRIAAVDVRVRHFPGDVPVLEE